MRIAETKKQALLYYEEEIEFSYDRNVLNTLYIFLVDIGAKRTIPIDLTEKRAYLIRLHESMTTKNPMFNPNIPFADIYPKFFMDVLYEKTSRSGNNISALSVCFNNWYKENAKNYLPTNQPEVVKKYSSGTIEDLSDQELSNIYSTIMLLNSNGLKSLFDSQKADSYFKRIKEEYDKRFP